MIWIKYFLTWGSLFCNDSTLYQLDIKPSNTLWASRENKSVITVEKLLLSGISKKSIEIEGKENIRDYIVTEDIY